MQKGQIRIIGGEWRGRKIKVPNMPNLRPTPDRVRETLFNWLANMISGAYCFDAFAGSGALGFEALSRGAKHVVMVDASSEVVSLLKEELHVFKSDRAEIYRANLPEQLKAPENKFDIVFLDPPFSQDLLLPCCFYLEEHGFLADEAYIYIETGKALEEKNLPKNWNVLKSKKAGQVFYYLILRKKAFTL